MLMKPRASKPAGERKINAAVASVMVSLGKAKAESLEEMLTPQKAKAESKIAGALDAVRSRVFAWVPDFAREHRWRWCAWI